MHTQTVQVGDRVVTTYKTGQYIAEVVEVNPPKSVVKILAVRKHPAQGDLHHPMEVDVPLFHQRRALSYQEKIVVMLAELKPYHGEIPAYRDSLQAALLAEIHVLERTIRWSQRALEEYRQLEKDYFGGP
ncbi:kinase [Brevibacillus sp. SYP-B805]|uniref:sporulation phosphorelay system protein KapB n=1 Tax=Brevibacillus sp. SYP-B805 TaxID=1578199 RepID=UPI0013EA525C|nr:sporulation phosphorelay system protein KapB [Brevibacillus sp. SYP-B805]NGQ96240.1 kinase [Brevibacillus sp. SYP-B805]